MVDGRYKVAMYRGVRLPCNLCLFDLFVCLLVRSAH